MKNKDQYTNQLRKESTTKQISFGLSKIINELYYYEVANCADSKGRGGRMMGYDVI